MTTCDNDSTDGDDDVDDDDLEWFKYGRDEATNDNYHAQVESANESNTRGKFYYYLYLHKKDMDDTDLSVFISLQSELQLPYDGSIVDTWENRSTTCAIYLYQSYFCVFSFLLWIQPIGGQ